MCNFDPCSDFKLPKPGTLWLMVFSEMHKALDSGSGISDSVTDLLDGLEGSTSG